jgi:hypothetical protein
MLFAIPVRDDRVHECAPGDGFARPSEHHLGGAVPVGDRPVPIDRNERVVGGLDEVFLFGDLGAQRCGCGLSLRDAAQLRAHVAHELEEILVDRLGLVGEELEDRDDLGPREYRCGEGALDLDVPPDMGAWEVVVDRDVVDPLRTSALEDPSRQTDPGAQGYRLGHLTERREAGRVIGMPEARRRQLVGMTGVG